MDNTQLAVRGQSSVLARVGTPDERQYLLEIMAEQLGIPSSDAKRRDVQAVIANAAQRTLEYGWIPGVHMHVQSFRNRKKSDAARTDVYDYSLVDGEKAWKDSLARWRNEFGKQWRYQRKPMSQEELHQEIRLTGYTQAIPANAYGMWSRIVVDGLHEADNPDDPLWSAGIWFGKIKTGTFWADDSLPTGVSSRDVAIRRADKRAAMQSELTLLPVDAESPETRLRQLTDHLRHERQYQVMAEAIPDDRPRAQIERSGEMVYAIEDRVHGQENPVHGQNGTVHGQPTPVHGQDDRPQVADTDEDDRPQVADTDDVEDGDYYDADDDGAEPASWADASGAWPQTEPELSNGLDNSGARPADPGARPQLCPHCHAPEGKPHASNCPVTLKQIGADAPAPASDNPIITFALADDSPLSEWAQETVRAYRALHAQSLGEDKRMTIKMYNSLRTLIPMALGKTDEKEDDAYKVLLTCLCGEEVNSKNLPGKSVGQLREVLIDPDGNQPEIQLLQQILLAAHLARKP